MPIVFQPAAPVAPGISALGGAAQQWSRDFPALVQQQGHILQAGNDLLHEGDLGWQRQMQLTEMINQRQAQQQSFYNQSALQNQQAQNRITEMMVPEQLHLFKLQNSLAAVGMDPNLSPEEKQRASLMLQSNIDPLQMKQQQANAQKAQMDFQQAQQTQQQQDQLRTMSADQINAWVQAHTITIRDDDGNPTGMLAFLNPMDGKYHVVDHTLQQAQQNNLHEYRMAGLNARHESIENSRDRTAETERHHMVQEGNTANAQQQNNQRQQTAEQQRLDREREQHETKWHAEFNKAYAEAMKDTLPATTESPDALEARRSTATEVARRKLVQHGMGRTIEEHMATWDRQHGRAPAATPGPQQGPPNLQQQTAGALNALGGPG